MLRRRRKEMQQSRLVGNDHFGNARHVVGHDRRVVNGHLNIVADTCAVIAHAMRRVHQNIDFEVAAQIADAAEEV